MVRIILLLLVAAIPAVGAPPPLPVVKSVSFGAIRTPGGGGVVGGQEARGTIELSGPAPCVDHCGTYVNGKAAGGMFVHVTSNNAVAAVQPSTGMVLVPVGQVEQTFTVLTSGVANPTPVLVSAWREGSPAQTTTLNVLPPSLTSFTLDQSTVVAGSTAHGAVKFNGVPASAGAVVATVSSSNPAAAQVPANVALDANNTVATFDIKTSGVSGNTPVTITAAYRDRKESVPLMVNAAAFTKFDGGQGNIAAELNGAAPSGGAAIALSSGNPNLVSVPAALVIPSGSSKAGIAVTLHPDYSEHTVTITATYNGVTRKADEHLLANIKPDLAIKEVTLRDRFGNSITHPQDAQSYKMCVAIELIGVSKFGNYLYPLSTLLRVDYLSPTGTGTSAGHVFDVPINFPITASGGAFIFDEAHTHGLPTATSTPDVIWFDPTCIDMPGLPQSGSYTDVTLTVDSNNKTDEANEGNNTYKLRVTRQ